MIIALIGFCEIIMFINGYVLFLISVICNLIFNRIYISIYEAIILINNLNEL